MFGFYRVCCAVPQLKIADVKYNAAEINSLYCEACEKGASAVVFPELSLTSASCGDIFRQNELLDEVCICTQMLAESSNETILIFGAPFVCGNSLYDCAVVAQNGRILGVVPAVNPSNRSVFASGYNADSSLVMDGRNVPFSAKMIFGDGKFTFGVTVGEDLRHLIPNASHLAAAGAGILFNISRFAETANSWEKCKKAICEFSARSLSAYVYSSAGCGESVTDEFCAGHCCIAESGEILKDNMAFQREGQLLFDEVDIEKIQNLRLRNTQDKYSYVDIQHVDCDEVRSCEELRDRYVEPLVFVPDDAAELDNIIAVQAHALADRIERIGAKTMVLGVSGGLDSTLALLICHKVCSLLGRPATDIIAFTLPGFGTTGRTYNNAVELIKGLGATFKEVNIKDAALQHFKDIGHDVNDIDVTYENTQARERTQILMDYANKSGGIVVGTGDLSELALGWCTYNGDHMSMYGVNCTVPKTLMRPLILRCGEWLPDNVCNILQDIADTPVSPELLPPSSSGDMVQKTEDILGPYELHDFFLYHFVQYGASPKKLVFLAEQAFEGIYSSSEIQRTLQMFIRRFFTQQFKRNAVPDGVKVIDISLSPRGAWNMASEVQFDAFAIRTEDKK